MGYKVICTIALLSSSVRPFGGDVLLIRKPYRGSRKTEVKVPVRRTCVTRKGRGVGSEVLYGKNNSSCVMTPKARGVI